MQFVSLAANTSYSDEQLESLLDGFGKIAFIGVVFLVLVFLILCVSIARRLARRRLRLMVEREAFEATEAGDVWSESARRVEPEPVPGASDRSDEDDTDDEDLYGKDWEPGDDDENPDDEDQPW